MNISRDKILKLISRIIYILFGLLIIVGVNFYYRNFLKLESNCVDFSKEFVNHFSNLDSVFAKHKTITKQYLIENNIQLNHQGNYSITDHFAYLEPFLSKEDFKLQWNLLHRPFPRRYFDYYDVNEGEIVIVHFTSSKSRLKLTFYKAKNYYYLKMIELKAIFSCF